jgi:hypothetical protein
MASLKVNQMTHGKIQLAQRHCDKLKIESNDMEEVN